MKTLLMIPMLALLAGCANHPPCPKPLDSRPPNHLAGHFTAARCTELPYCTWPVRPPKHPRAVVIFVNGLDSVSRDYGDLGIDLAQHGYAVYSPEKRTGIYDPVVKRRGDAPENWHDWVDDLKLFTTFVRAKHPGVPFFYHAHSMGGLIGIAATAEALRDRTDVPRGIIVHSPGFPLMDKAGRPLERALLHAFIGRYRVAHLRTDPGSKMCPTGDREYNCIWEWSDDRVRQGYTGDFFLAAAQLGHQARLNSSELKLPVLAMSGGNDGVVTLNGQLKDKYRAFMDEELTGRPKQFVPYPVGYHTLTAPPTQKQAQADIVKWLNAH